MSSKILMVIMILCGINLMAAEYEEVEIYTDLRKQILELNSDQLDLNDKSKPLAIIMETGYEKAVVTLTAVADGTTSLYFSSGGGFIGSGKYQQVRDEALTMLKAAQNYKGEMQAVSKFPLPKENYTSFYLITGNGVYSNEVLTEDLGLEKYPLSPVFHQGHKLIAYIRAAQEHKDTKKESAD